MFHIGLLASTLTSAAEMLRCVRPSEHEGRDRREPELTLSWAPLAAGTTSWQRGDPDTVRSQLVLSTARLRQAGAHFFVCADDSAYVPLDRPGPDLALPGLHVAPVVAAEAQRQGFGTVGVLGTRWTLDSSRYADDLEPMGITTVPLPLREQTTLHSIIYDEMVHDRFWLRSRDHVLELIHDMSRRGCEAVVLGCHELTALVGPAVSPLPLLDPTALLAEAALAVATGERALPQWAGGPVMTAGSTPVLSGGHASR